ncbi:hypothetical protein AVEN_181712-1 [Araneus ventricosus]|uniref:Uncharacterized protein n=1 Tax=Araneus ventricosus TaxID=182803 RepID=A0A4Y2EBA1_ARAVE|nr:hypothetical protein AVEN_181712-1 [Araneus ventricosus]
MGINNINYNIVFLCLPSLSQGTGPPVLSFPIRKTSGQLLCLWRTWHAFSLCHQVPPHAFLPPQVSSRSTHRSLVEINNQPPPAKKQNDRPPQLYHQPRRPT